MAKAIGATTEQEFNSKFEAFLETAVANATAHTKLVTDFAALQTAHNETVTALTEAHKAILGKITALETTLGNPATLTESKIKEIATIAGSSEASKAVAACGFTPPAPPAAGSSLGAKTAVDQLVAAGKFDEAFAADANIQAEFITKESYGAYMRNRASVSIHQRKS